MERKNTMLLTVIAVVTLLVAVIGATFAYYSVFSGANNSTTALNTSTGAAATVTYTAGESQLYLKVTAAQMAESNHGHVLYAQSSDINASDNQATDFVLGTFAVTGAGASDVHECTFNWTLTTTGTLNELTDTANGRITLSAGSAVTDTGAITNTTGTIFGTHAFSNSQTSGTAKFRATGNQAMTIHGTASITNTNETQNTTGNDISGLSGVVTTFEVSNVSCTAVETAIDNSNVIPANAAYLRATTGKIYYTSLDSQAQTIVNNVLSVYVQQGLTYDQLDYGGNVLPSGVQENDSYLEGDYAYQYHPSVSGWEVQTPVKTKVSYGTILSTINGTPVTSLDNAFKDCINMTTAPAIPNTVTKLLFTYRNCTSLQSIPTIPDSVTNMRGAFYGCTALATAPTIPSSVTNMEKTFEGCTSLTGIPVVNANPLSYTDAFKDTQITGIGGSTSLSAQLYATK